MRRNSFVHLVSSLVVTSSGKANYRSSRFIRADDLIGRINNLWVSPGRETVHSRSSCFVCLSFLTGPPPREQCVESRSLVAEKRWTVRMDTKTEDCRKEPETSQDGRKLKALLVGESILGASFLVNRLWQRGCHCQFATSDEELRALLKGQDIDLVLCPTRLRGRNLLPLIDLLEGSNISLFYAQSVEEGCWWLPALRKGQRCFGSFAVRPSEFISVLDEVIDEARPGHRNETPVPGTCQPS